ncbi:MAG: hypothetical protein K2J73_08485 [Oscillospiraceae bacterium]|nr:hypothetical protein [Oscillospiraceae bacterium]
MSNEIFTHPNKYGYNLSINHPVIGAFYNDFFRRFKLSHKMGMGDKQRPLYEKLLWKYLRSICRSYDKNLLLPPISDNGFLFTQIIGEQSESLNIFLTEKLNLYKALDQFAKKYSEELIPIAETLKPSQTYLDWVSGDYDYHKQEK